MPNANFHTIWGLGATATLAAALALASAGTASAGVTGCSASGKKQETGAVIGAIVGGVIGNKVGGRHAAGETVAGAAAGAAAGSAIGCEMQKSDARRASTYEHEGYRLRSNIAPARYDRIQDTFVARAAVSVRAAPTARAERVGGLRVGERFQALAGVRGADWILVGQNGVGVGYVPGASVRPAVYRR